MNWSVYSAFVGNSWRAARLGCELRRRRPRHDSRRLARQPERQRGRRGSHGRRGPPPPEAPWGRRHRRLRQHRREAGSIGRWAYPTSKAALIHLTRCQAADLARDNIRVNSVSPAWTWSKPLREAANDDRALAQRFAADLHILQRFADPAEVAEAVVFLCSEHASFITGCDLACDGGNSVLGPEGLRSPLVELRRAARESGSD